MKKSLSLLLLLAVTNGLCQDLAWQDLEGGQLTIIQSSNAPFPHPDRMTGHLYGDSLFSFTEHYNDSSVAIFIPEGFKAGRATDMVFYFHGWGNSIQESLERFQLLEQFSASRKNAIFVFPEGPKNSKDSFGGKLEDPGVFAKLVNEILLTLQSDGKIKRTKPGSIILSGHSGAYHVISAILSRGGLSENITEVYLFDALYGQLEKFTHWLETNQGRLVNIVAPNGGTLDNSVDLLEDLRDWDIPFKAYDQNSVTLDDLKAEQIVVVFTSLGHSETIDPYLRLALQSSHLKSRD